MHSVLLIVADSDNPALPKLWNAVHSDVEMVNYLELAIHAVPGRY